MTSGLVTSVTPRHVGDTLAADVAAGVTVLPVGDAGAFAEDFTTPRFVTIGPSQPLRYIAVENDDDAAQQSVTLADPLTVAYEEGLPVALWDPEIEGVDKRAVEFIANIRLDDQDATVPPIPVGIPHQLVPLAGVYTLTGAQVTLNQDAEGDWWIEQVIGRTPSLDSDYVRSPSAIGLLPADVPWPTGTWQTVTTWETHDLASITYEPATGIWRLNEDGIYLAIFGASFQENSTPARGVRPRIHYLDGTSTDARMVKLPAVAGVTAVEVAIHRRFLAGEGLSFEALQTSGGTLNLLGSVGGNRSTEVTIHRTGS